MSSVPGIPFLPVFGLGNRREESPAPNTPSVHWGVRPWKTATDSCAPEERKRKVQRGLRTQTAVAGSSLMTLPGTGLSPAGSPSGPLLALSESSLLGNRRRHMFAAERVSQPAFRRYGSGDRPDGLLSARISVEAISSKLCASPMDFEGTRSTKQRPQPHVFLT